MYTVFIADLHLNPEHSEITELFLAFLKSLARQADALYILGDLFETWIGDDDHSALALTIQHALKELSTAGVPIYIMPGNRDFLLGKRFATQSQCQLLTDPTVINLYGESTLLMHGDLLCTDDHAYLKFRAWSHHPVLQWLFLRLPLYLRHKIASKLRAKSKQHVKNAASAIMDVTPAGINFYLQQYPVKQIIHGHTHRPSLHFFKQEQLWVQHIVLSDWDAQGHALICYPNGKKLLKTIA